MRRLWTTLGFGVVAACSSFTAASLPDAGDRDAGVSSDADASSITDAAAPETRARFACPANAIVCDDFERSEPQVPGAIPDLQGDASGLQIGAVNDSAALVATVGTAGRMAVADRYERAALLRPEINVPRRFIVHFKISLVKPSVVQQFFQFMDLGFPGSSSKTSMFLTAGAQFQQNGAFFVQYDATPTDRKTLMIDSLAITDGAQHDVLITVDLDAPRVALTIDDVPRGTLTLKAPIDAPQLALRSGISAALGIDTGRVDVDELFIAPSLP